MSNPKRLPAFTPRTLLYFLWERALKTLQPHELEWAADGASGFVTQYAQQLETVAEALACLVASDSETRGGHMSSGSFQTGGDLSDLLFAHAAHMGLLSGIGLIADESWAIIKHPLLAPANLPQSGD